MEKTLKFIAAKKEELRQIRAKLRHDSSVARRLEFDTEVKRIQRDMNKELDKINLLEDVAKQIQEENSEQTK